MKLNKVMSHVFRVALLLSVILSYGCSAAMQAPGLEYAVSPGELIQIGKFQTMALVRSALGGAWWSTIIVDPSSTKFLIVWPIGERGVAFYAWDSAKLTTITSIEELKAMAGFNRGQLGDIEDVSNLVSFLQNKGWAIVDAAAINTAVKAGITKALAQATRLDTFFIVPVNMADPYGVNGIENMLCDPDHNGVSDCATKDT